VYRVECPKCGLGPYALGWKCASAHVHRDADRLVDAHDDRTHPGPIEDIPGITWSNLYDQHRDHRVCGLDSPEALWAWFGDWLPRLIDRGFEVTSWQVPERHVRRGKRQLMFRRDLATDRTVLPL